MPAENDGTLTVIDTKTLTRTKTIQLGAGMRPMGTAAAPAGDVLYVTTGRSKMLLVVDPATDAVVGSVEAGERPWGVAVSPDGKTVYTANGPANDVSVIDAAARRVTAKIPVGRGPWGLADAPGRRGQCADVPYRRMVATSFPFATIACADWSKFPRKRQVFEAVVREKTVRWLQGSEWTFEQLVAVARERAQRNGPTLVCVDAPLGVPRAYWELLRASRGTWMRCQNFAEWLALADDAPNYFTQAASPLEWSPDRPFFSVPRGKGGLGRWLAAAADRGVGSLRRRVEEQTRGKSVFITAGIPGVVGAAAQDVWRGLAKCRESDVALWPFGGSLAHLAERYSVVVAEVYPRAAYSIALSDEPVISRAPLSIGKTQPVLREAALRRLRTCKWLTQSHVRLEDTRLAAENDDAFDAFMTAVALMRCVVEAAPLSNEDLEDATAEGGILPLGGLNLGLPEQVLIG